MPRISGVGLTADAHHISAPREDGVAVCNAIRFALQDGHLNAEQVRYINTHGTSSLRGDIANRLQFIMLMKVKLTD